MFLFTLSQSLYKFDPKICELWEALVQLHDSQFPGQVRKTDMNKPLCVSFISGKNLGGKKKKNRVRLESLWTLVWSGTLVWVKVASGDDVIYTSMSVSPVIIVPQGPFLLELQKVLYDLQVRASYQQSVSLFVLFSLGSFSFLDYYMNTDLSLRGSFVLIMLAHSAVHW